ncbi:hypothetical protein [Streptomyces sp900116325]|uniref:Uncharacterized protein n=1 Tax=Streptomyces sp. 900116325 TaxID=3154295 RepID=A0ABV2UDJ1_9ACTN
MAGTTAFLWVLLGGCGVAVATSISQARADIARIPGRGRESARQP